MARCMFEGGRAALVRPASGGLPQVEHEVMHVVDRRLLLAHLEGEYVADRDHAGKAALGHDGQMADTLPRHHRGAFLDRRVGRAGRDWCRHDVRHLGRGGIAPRRDYATQDVALGEDADQPPALGHHEPTDAPLAHELGGLEHGFPRLHRDDVTALSGKNVLDGRHVPVSWLGFPRYYRAVPGCATLFRPPEAGASMAQARINVGPLDAHARQVAGALAIIGGLTPLPGLFPAPRVFPLVGCAALMYVGIIFSMGGVKDGTAVFGFPLLILSVLDAWLPLIHKGHCGLLAGVFLTAGPVPTP